MVFVICIIYYITIVSSLLVLLLLYIGIYTVLIIILTALMNFVSDLSLDSRVTNVVFSSY